jgi:hypothetical protein
MGKAAKGTLLKIGDGAATELFTTVYQVRDISMPGEAHDLEDTTYQTATVEEQVATIRRLTECTVQVNHNPIHATHSTAGLLGDLRDGTFRNFELVCPAATTTGADVITFGGHVTGFSGTRNVGGALVNDVTIKPHTTSPTWTTRATVS